MSLSERFRQLPVNPRETPAAALMTTHKASGPQWAKTSLIADLLVQIRFSIRVDDVVTYPLIPLGSASERHVPVDVYFTTEADPNRIGQNTLLIIDEGDHASDSAAKIAEIEALRAACAANDADFRILTDQEIRTAYLQNARLLVHLANKMNDDESDASQALFAILDAGPTTVRKAAMAMGARGIPIEEAKTLIDQWVASRMVACDLSVPYREDSIISRGAGELSMENRGDPLLRAIQDCPRR